MNYMGPKPIAVVPIRVQPVFDQKSPAITRVLCSVEVFEIENVKIIFAIEKRSDFILNRIVC